MLSMQTATHIESIRLDKQQCAFLTREGSDGMGVVSGTVEQIGQLLGSLNNRGCVIVFDTYAAPNFKRCFNAAIKRANRIAAVAGVTLADPVEYVIDGHKQTDKYAMAVQ